MVDLLNLFILCDNCATVTDDILKIYVPNCSYFQTALISEFSIDWYRRT